MERQPVNRGLGRIYIPDDRDKEFHMSLAPRKLDVKPLWKYWDDNSWWGDQLSTPQCVGYSWAHWLADGPVVHPGTQPPLQPQFIYTEAQKNDQWIGENYDGTSVRAGAKVLQSLGYIQSYYWGWDIQTVVDSILTKGPVVMGTNWYSEMFYPNPKNNRINVKGTIEGGHAYVINGCNTTTQVMRIKNSWGRQWGDKGHAYISFRDVARLIRENGEACLALEVPK
jgi:hypothetical protein